MTIFGVQVCYRAVGLLGGIAKDVDVMDHIRLIHVCRDVSVRQAYQRQGGKLSVPSFEELLKA